MFWNKRPEPPPSDFDLASLSYLALKELRNRVDVHMQAQFKDAQEAFRNDFLAKMAEFGLTIADLKPKKKRARSKAKPRYIHPDNAELTWSGRGLPPTWLKELIAEGRDKEEFRAEPEPAGAPTA
jgi:DNA-binding protein H-NS